MVKKLMTIVIAIIGLVGGVAFPAHANWFSDRIDNVQNGLSDYWLLQNPTWIINQVTDHSIDKAIRKATGVAADHPVVTGVTAASMVALTIAVPSLASADEEVLSSMTEVAEAAIVDNEELLPTTMVEGIGVTEEFELEAVQEVVESAAESESSGITEERCYVALDICGQKIPPEDRDPKRVLSTAQKEILKDRACGPKWCISELTGKKFSRSEAVIDHIVPHARGGKTSISNSQVVSQAENLLKGIKLP